MRLLKRTTLFTEQKSDDVRLDQLERRIFPLPTKWAYAAVTTPQAAPGGAQTLTFDRFWTDAPHLFRTANNAVGDTQILSNEFGVYIATSSVEWEDVGVDYAHQHHISTLRLAGGNLAAFGASAASASVLQYPPTGTNGPLDTGDVMIALHSPWDYLSTQPMGMSLIINNLHTASVNIQRAFLFIALLPSSEKEVDYVVFG